MARAYSEFELIRRYFTRPTPHTDLSAGDDAALLRVSAGMQLAVSTDTLAEGTHFFCDAAPRDLGWKTLAVNLSDLAAMGAVPRWATLALTLPGADAVWVELFAEGFFECAGRYGVDVVGGDTTQGPRSMTVTVFGEVPEGEAITRAGGLPGDDLWISGTPGLAALGLNVLQGNIHLADAGHALAALHRPVPRVELGLALRGQAHAMLDVSDGLAGDLGHLCRSSNVGAVIEVKALPLGSMIDSGADEALARCLLLSGGDDYELLFAASPEVREELAAIGETLRLTLSRIGRLTESVGEILLAEAAGNVLRPLDVRGYEHFTEPASILNE
ncbi:MAG: thiamine-phosphate kinase [Azoarcus sp.]|nr:thiamine-phosphate kinase [Azoarcus sp.]